MNGSFTLLGDFVRFHPMRSFRVALVIALLVWQAISTHIGVAGDFQATRDVHVTVGLSRTTLRPGQTENLQIAFSTADDIYVIARPTVEIRLASTQLVTLIGSPNQDVDRSTGYISTRSPVTQRITVSKGTHEGTYTVKGSLVYFYCSRSKGWCRKQVEPFEIRITIAA
jgi:hypothetical protein